MKMIFRSPITVWALILLLSTSCSNKGVEPAPTPDPNKDKWETEFQTDSAGNQYSYAVTHDFKLELRIKKPDGSPLLSYVYDDADSLQSILSGESPVAFELTAPKKRIDYNVATLSVYINRRKKSELTNKYTSFITNVNLGSGQLFTKRYEVRSPSDWGFKLFNGDVVQWYKGSILVREGPESGLSAGDLRQRGTNLICYNLDFTERYVVDIDLNFAYYPTNYLKYIPINDREYLTFGNVDRLVDEPGTFGRLSILTSVEDQWNGIKAIVWKVDLYKTEQLPSGYLFTFDDYSVIGDQVQVTYSIYNEEGQFQKTTIHNWYISNGEPADKLGD